MTPFTPATVPDSEIEFTVNAMLEKWIAGHQAFRKAFPADSVDNAHQAMRKHLFELRESATTFLNDTYQVEIRQRGDERLPLLWLSIKRIDRQPIRDWRELQQIKNELVGPECEAIELYPAESRLTDSANQYHLWACPDPKFRFPIGWEGRLVSDEQVGKSVNKPLP
jgi:hypothetical protein